MNSHMNFFQTFEKKKKSLVQTHTQTIKNNNLTPFMSLV